VRQILTTSAFDHSLRKFSDTEIESIREAIGRLPDVFGNPHHHAGLGMRKLRKNVYELRAGLKIRVLFAVAEVDLVLLLAGNHNDVANWIKNK
jgi:mRNA-degrading endonuclease RelE of RelBE toxin-antitoxin system